MLVNQPMSLKQVDQVEEVTVLLLLNQEEQEIHLQQLHLKDFQEVQVEEIHLTMLTLVGAVELRLQENPLQVIFLVEDQVEMAVQEQQQKLKQVQ
jgi:hypothetical protein